QQNTGAYPTIQIKVPAGVDSDSRIERCRFLSMATSNVIYFALPGGFSDYDTSVDIKNCFIMSIVNGTSQSCISVDDGNIASVGGGGGVRARGCTLIGNGTGVRVSGTLTTDSTKACAIYNSAIMCSGSGA